MRIVVPAERSESRDLSLGALGQMDPGRLAARAVRDDKPGFMLDTSLPKRNIGQSFRSLALLFGAIWRLGVSRQFQARQQLDVAGIIGLCLVGTSRLVRNRELRP